MSQPYQPPKKIIDTFISNDYAQSTDKENEFQLQKAIDKITSGNTVNLGTDTYTAVNTTNPPTDKYIQCNAPLQLPDLYSNNWVNYPIFGSGKQTVSLYSYGATASGGGNQVQVQFTFYKLGYLVFMFCPDITFLCDTADHLYFNFASRPEILPSQNMMENSVSYDVTSPAFQACRKEFSTAGILTCYRLTNATTFTAGHSFTLNGNSLVYICDKAGY